MAENVATSGTAAVIGGTTTENAVLIQGAGAVSGSDLSGSMVTGTAAPPQTSSVVGTANSAALPTPAAQAAAPAQIPAPAAAAPAQTPAPAAAAPAAPAQTEAKTDATAPAEDIDAIKGENYALKAGVKPECAADVITLAKSRVKDGTTLEQAVNEVVSAYPAFKNAPPPVMTPSVSISNDSAADSAEDAKIDAIMGIKPEKKEG